MAESRVILEGSTKNIISTKKDDEVLLLFKDSETAFDGEKKAKFKDKGLIRKKISKCVFEFLDSYNIPNHYIKEDDGNTLLVKKLEMIPLSVVIYNIAAGALSRRFKLKQGQILKYPVIEYYLKKENGNDLFIAESHAYAFDYATPEEMKHIARLSSKVNAVLKSFMDRRRLKLVNYKLEFGRYRNQIFLADEITPDTARLWHIGDENKVNMKYFNFENSKAKQAYNQIYERFLGK